MPVVVAPTTKRMPALKPNDLKTQYASFMTLAFPTFGVVRRIVFFQLLLIDLKWRYSLVARAKRNYPLALLVFVAVLGLPIVPGLDLVTHVRLPLPVLSVKTNQLEAQQRTQHIDS